VFDAQREPGLKKGATLGQWAKHDRWLEKSCRHGGVKLAIRIGNMSYVEQLRESVRDFGANRFPILLQRVLYSGTHAGDSIPVRMVPKLQGELRVLKQRPATKELLPFIKAMERLCGASIKTCKPIIF
jgi:hypothetical protein